MKTPTMCILGTVPCLVLGSNIGKASAVHENASGGAPHDVFGRPLADSLGPVDYREENGAWIERRVNGGFAPAQPTDFAPTPSMGAAGSSSGLGPYSIHPVGSWPEAVAIGDVTGDGRPDVVMTTTFYFDAQSDYCVFVFAQKPDGTLGAPVRFPYLATANRNGIVLADLNEDGVLDVVVGHDSGITVLLADGRGSLKPGVVTPDADANTLAAMDVDRDGHLDIISLGWSCGATIFYGDGHGGFSHTRSLATNASGYNDLEIGDLTGDGIPDLAVMSGQLYATPNLTIHRHNGVSDFVPLTDTYFMGSSELTAGIGLGDVIGDGLSDAVLSRPRNSPTWLWIMRQDQSGRLSGPTTIPSYDIPEPVVVTDINGDGLKDAVVLHGGWNALGVYVQQPGSGLGPEALYPVPYASHYAPQGLAVGDFTSDGCPDVAFADYNHGLVTLPGTMCSAPTPTLLSLVRADVAPGRVELAWLAPGRDIASATVYRRTADGYWQAMSPVSAAEVVCWFTSIRAWSLAPDTATGSGGRKRAPRCSSAKRVWTSLSVSSSHSWVSARIQRVAMSGWRSPCRTPLRRSLSCST